MKIHRCKTCVETNTRPTTAFDEKGICLPCKNVSASAIQEINWEERYKILKEIITTAKSHTPEGEYDCIIGVSGGKDSLRQALFAKEVGFNPLLVSCTYPPEQVTQRGAYNLANLIELGFDTIVVQPAPLTSKEMMLYCLKTYGNLFNASELALYSSLPITAIAYNIPLILLGENPALAFGTDVGSHDYSGNNMRNMNTLKGGNPRQFAPNSIPDNKLFWYRYPNKEKFEKANINIVYLGWFMKDFNDYENAKIALNQGLQTRIGDDAKPENIGGIQPHVALDDDFVIINQMLKYLKFGFGKATQEVGVAIRSGRINREEGKKIVQTYDGSYHQKYLDALCDYLQITEDKFWEIIDPFINKEIFEKKDGKWIMKEDVDVW